MRLAGNAQGRPDAWRVPAAFVRAEGYVTSVRLVLPPLRPALDFFVVCVTMLTAINAATQTNLVAPGVRDNHA